MPASTVVQNHEEYIAFLPTERLITEGPWTLPQQRLLEVLQHEKHRYASIAKICRLAGYAGNMPWYEAMKDECFVTVIRALGIKRSSDDLKRWQQRLLEVVQHPENRNKSGAEICRLAGYKDHGIWQRAVKDERFVTILEALGVTIRRDHLPSHLDVEPATNIEEELVKDVWDIRRLKHDYPKHVSPAAYEVDFSWIVNPVLREQVKHYFRLRLTRWKAGTFKRALYHLKSVLVLLPSDIHVGNLQRRHVETFAAIRELQQGSYPVTRSAVARRAGVSVVFLRSHPDLLQALSEAERQRRLAPSVNAGDLAKDQVIAALRRRLDEMKQQNASKDQELRRKQREIDRLYGKLASASPLTDAELRHVLAEALERLAAPDLT